MIANDSEIRERLVRLEVQHETIIDRLAQQDEQRARMDAKLDHVVSVIDQAKGGWRALAVTGGIGGAMGAFVMKVGGMLHWWKS
jgi:hypothetical protein